jgi:hypothetical protein
MSKTVPGPTTTAQAVAELGRITVARDAAVAAHTLKLKEAAALRKLRKHKKGESTWMPGGRVGLQLRNVRMPTTRLHGGASRDPFGHRGVK